MYQNIYSIACPRQKSSCFLSILKFIRFKLLFNSLADREKYIHPFKEKSACFDDVLNIKELFERQEEIDRAVLFRIRHRENTFVHIEEASDKEIFLFYQDKLPLFSLRMKMWGWLM